MLDEVLLAALVIGWAVVLLPGALRSRRSTDPMTTVGGFTRAMSVLRDRPQGREIMVPHRADRIVGHGAGAPRAAVRPSEPSRRIDLLARRRTVFVRLLVATGASLLLAVAFGGLLWPAFVVAALGLGGYVALLRHYKVERDAARHVVVRAFDAPRADEVAHEPEREPVAVGAEPSGWQVATRFDEPWQGESTVRIRRWDT